MAAVPMSKGLRIAIVENANKVFANQLKTLEEAVWQSITTPVYEHLIFNYNSIGMTKEFYDKVNAVMAQDTKQRKNYVDNSTCAVIKFGCQNLLTLVHKISVPAIYWWPQMHTAYGSDCPIQKIEIKLTFDEFFNCTTSVDALLFNTVDKIRAYVKKIDERKKFIALVENTAQAANSLKQFLTAWPEGRSLVPDEYLNRLQQKSAKVMNKVDLDEDTRRNLSGTLLINKLQNKD